MKQIQGPVNCFQTAYLLLMHMDGVCVCARAAHAACSKVVQAKRCLSDTCRLISGHKEMIVAMIMLIIAGNAVVLAFPDMYGLRSGHKEMITVTMITVIIQFEGKAAILAFLDTCRLIPGHKKKTAVMITGGKEAGRVMRSLRTMRWRWAVAAMAALRMRPMHWR
eukprot:scaffold33075_cov19-Tisochrysis_lutea.AAC.1